MAEENLQESGNDEAAGGEDAGANASGAERQPEKAVKAGDGQGQEGQDTGKTLLEDPGEEEAVAAPADWPGDWREKLAGDDEKALKELQRMKAPTDLFKRLNDAQKKIRSGKLKEDNPFPADGSDEDKARWRKENGRPENTDGYLDKLPEGLVIGDADKPLVDRFLSAAHDAGAPQEEVNRALSAYYEIKEDQAAERAEMDKAVKVETEEALRAELGANYRAEMQGIMTLLDGAPEGVKDFFMNARGADGTPLASHPDTLRWLRHINNEINPAATVVRAGSGNPMQGIADEIKEIEGLMADRSSEYWSGPKSADLKARYRELLEAQDKVKARDAA